eukprot:2077262-Rhodomonas_salina.5
MCHLPDTCDTHKTGRRLHGHSRPQGRARNAGFRILYDSSCDGRSGIPRSTAHRLRSLPSELRCNPASLQCAVLSRCTAHHTGSSCKKKSLDPPRTHPHGTSHLRSRSHTVHTSGRRD